jgi:hypothetical protein
MAQIINISIDLTKVDKSQIKEVTLKSGKVAKFLNLTLFENDEQDQYGNICSLSLPQTEEERNAKAPKTYVGNGKRVWSGNNKPTQATTSTQSEDLSDLPF